MEARTPFVPCPCPRVFSKIQVGTITTNQCSLYDESSGKGTIIHLEVFHTTSSYIDMSPCIVALIRKGTSYLNTSHKSRPPSRLQPTTTPWNICVSITNKLFPQYLKAGQGHINIPRGSPSVFSRCYHLPNLLLYVGNHSHDMSL